MKQLTQFTGLFAFLFPCLLPLLPARLRRLLLGGCLCGMIYLTLFRSNSIRGVSWIPFVSWTKWKYADIRWQIYMNVFLFMPYGALLRSLKFPRPVLIAMLTSLTIELTQLFLHLGWCETDDLISNTLGAILGIALFLAADSLFRRLKPRH